MKKTLILCATLSGALGTGSASAEYLIDIKTDLKGKYYVVSKEGPAEYPTLVVKRALASGGMHYTKRIFDCKARTLQILGSGSTLKEMEDNKASGNPEQIDESTIGGQLWRHACYGK